MFLYVVQINDGSTLMNANLQNNIQNELENIVISTGMVLTNYIDENTTDLNNIQLAKSSYIYSTQSSFLNNTSVDPNILLLGSQNSLEFPVASDGTSGSYTTYAGGVFIFNSEFTNTANMTLNINTLGLIPLKYIQPDGGVAEIPANFVSDNYTYRFKVVDLGGNQYEARILSNIGASSITTGIYSIETELVTSEWVVKDDLNSKEILRYTNADGNGSSILTSLSRIDLVGGRTITKFFRAVPNTSQVVFSLLLLPFLPNNGDELFCSGFFSKDITTAPIQIAFKVLNNSGVIEVQVNNVIDGQLVSVTSTGGDEFVILNL